MNTELLNQLFDRLGELEGKVDFLMENSQKMRVEDVAGYLGKKKNTIYAWICRNLIPYHNDGRPFFLKEEIDKWQKNGGTRGVKKSLEEQINKEISFSNGITLDSKKGQAKVA